MCRQYLAQVPLPCLGASSCRAHPRFMMNFPAPASPPSDHPACTDPLRLAVAAYLARFKGSSREHTESDLRCFLTWCAGHALDPLGAWRPHLGVVHPVDAGDPPVQVVHCLPPLLCGGRVLPDLRDRRPAGALTRRARPPAMRPAAESHRPWDTRHPSAAAKKVVNRSRMRLATCSGGRSLHSTRRTSKPA